MPKVKEGASTVDPLEGVGEVVDLGEPATTEPTLESSNGTGPQVYRTKRLDNSLEAEHGAYPGADQRRFWVPLTMSKTESKELTAIAAHSGMNVRSFLIYQLINILPAIREQWTATEGQRLQEEAAAKAAQVEQGAAAKEAEKAQKLAERETAKAVKTAERAANLEAKRLEQEKAKAEKAAVAAEVARLKAEQAAQAAAAAQAQAQAAAAQAPPTG